MAKKRKPSTKTDLIVLIVFCAGLALFAYPFVARAVNTVITSAQLARDKKIAAANVKKQEAAIKRQNELLAKQGLQPNAEIFTQKGQGVQEIKALKDHLIGAVTIPTLNLNLPLYDTTSEMLMQSGAVVLPGTSFPTGGKGTHTVVTAHSGIPSKTLFNDLEQLKKGQLFIFTVDGEYLAYKVEKIQTIEPDDVSQLKIDANRDLATLMTCTPIGMNTHRLLVTGYRVPYTPAVAKQASAGKDRAWWQSIGVLAAASVGLLLALVILYRLLTRKRRLAKAAG